ncbi:phosphatase domain-containing putative toxin [Lignipirellula cremea]|uniref:Dual specificity phosphatase, catalytic domain n=1 Tax=Lignipirellula cremea TaxID=2528010 RepID=A0A518DZJ4_9BACT|nr:dual specificity protein phosphatase family protein [Lignipirellula cremea]QDU97264.1 hypothetical protein Pla8534_51090 [Lignipirellula cremea]
MRPLLPGGLWIGNVFDVADLSRVFDVGIEAIVDLAMNEKPLQLTRELMYWRIPLVDGGDNSPARLRTAVQTVDTLIENQIPTLLYCSAGMSRSVAIAAAAIARHRGQAFEKVLLELVTGRPHDVSPVLWNDICHACSDIPSASSPANQATNLQPDG